MTMNQNFLHIDVIRKNCCDFKEKYPVEFWSIKTTSICDVHKKDFLQHIPVPVIKNLDLNYLTNLESMTHNAVSKFIRGCQFVAGKDCKNVVQELPSQCPPIHKMWNGGYQQTSGALRCHRVWGQRVDSDVDGSDAARCSVVPQFAFHSEQHGCVRIVAHQCGWLGCRLGKAANPGPVSRKRHIGVAMVLGQRH